MEHSHQIYNYRHSRARRVIENTFGILIQTWQVFTAEINANLDLVDKIILAATCLHNYRLIKNENLKPHQNKYVPQNVTRVDCDLDQISTQQASHTLATAVGIRRELTDFFVSEGDVPWQYNMI